MKTFVEYGLLIILTFFLQVFLLNNLQVNTYVHPSIFLTFLIILPMEMKGIWVLLLTAAMGVTMDFLTANPGIYTISTLFIAFIRPLVLLVMVGTQDLHDGGVPSSHRLGFKRFFNYTFTMVFIMNLIFYTLEKLTFDMFHITLLRVLLTSIVSTILIYICQALFVKYTKR